SGERGALLGYHLPVDPRDRIAGGDQPVVVEVVSLRSSDHSRRRRPGATASVTTPRRSTRPERARCRSRSERAVDGARRGRENEQACVRTLDEGAAAGVVEVAGLVRPEFVPDRKRRRRAARELPVARGDTEQRATGPAKFEVADEE